MFLFSEYTHTQFNFKHTNFPQEKIRYIFKQRRSNNQDFKEDVESKMSLYFSIRNIWWDFVKELSGFGSHEEIYNNQ